VPAALERANEIATDESAAATGHEHPHEAIVANRDRNAIAAPVPGLPDRILAQPSPLARA
jgi:hypothetical protein